MTHGDEGAVMTNRDAMSITLCDYELNIKILKIWAVVLNWMGLS